MTAPSVVGFKRVSALCGLLDHLWQPISDKACTQLAGVWVGRLNSGEYLRIDLLMSDDTIVRVKKLRKPFGKPLHLWLTRVE